MMGAKRCWGHLKANLGRGRVGRTYGGLSGLRLGYVRVCLYQSVQAKDALSRLALRSGVSKSAVVDALIEAATMRNARFKETSPGRVREIAAFKSKVRHEEEADPIRPLTS